MFVMYWGDGVIISHYKAAAKKLMFDVNNVKMDYGWVMEEEDDTTH